MVYWDTLGIRLGGFMRHWSSVRFHSIVKHSIATELNVNANFKIQANSSLPCALPPPTVVSLVLVYPSSCPHSAGRSYMPTSFVVRGALGIWTQLVPSRKRVGAAKIPTMKSAVAGDVAIATDFRL
ncbi:hypothetical protein ONZ45_g15967 [Pleurotus djamor]|nr:hypothetical protein ONZ45_g15967 [Pleurotus djamor]